MAKSRLRCLFFSDILPWERGAVEPLIEVMSKDREVHSQDVTEDDGGLLKQPEPGTVYWILAKDWRGALQFLKVPSKAESTIFVSVFELSSPKSSIYQLAAKKLFASIPSGVSLLTHSPLNYRFFTEMEGLPSNRVSYLPLPFQNAKIAKQAEPRKQLTVGTFAPFVSDSNSNYFLSVAHYLVKKKPGIRFRLLGSGPLYPHISQMIADLELGDCVDVVETCNYLDVNELDVLLYGPLRNDHFLPIMIAANLGIPVLANEITGIEDLIKDGHTGFLVPVNETKPMSELVLRLLQDEILRTGMGKKLKESLKEKFSTDSLLEGYQAVLFGMKSKKNHLEKAA